MADLAQVAGAEAYPLTNYVHKVWDFGDDCRFRASGEGHFTVVHNWAVVIGNTKSTGHRVVIYLEVVLFTWE